MIQGRRFMLALFLKDAPMNQRLHNISETPQRDVSSTGFSFNIN